MIVIVDYGMGNIQSIANMLKKIGVVTTISSDTSTIENADRLILPGVGAFDKGMENLAVRGLIPLLNTKVLKDKTPVLGLCLGAQLFTQRSEEGKLSGLGWLEAETVRFKFNNTHGHLKVPHMGWNAVRICRPTPLFKDISADPRFYFVHSYHLVCKDTNILVGKTYYAYEFVSAVVKDNIVGVQFHPEKSHKFGMQLFRNFLEYF